MGTPKVEDGDIVRLRVWLALHARGKACARVAEEIRHGIGFGDRYLRAVVHRATELGVLICADNDGYFLPATRDEADEAIGRLRSQGADMLKRAAALERLADREWSVTGTGQRALL